MSAIIKLADNIHFFADFLNHLFKKGNLWRFKTILVKLLCRMKQISLNTPKVPPEIKCKEK